MAVISSDVKIRYSGGATNAIADASLGGVMSSVGITPGADANLFDNVSAGEATAGEVTYRCCYVFNSNAADTLNTASVWLSANTPSPTTDVEIGLDPAGVGNGSTTGVAAVIADEADAPAGVTFFPAANAGDALAIGNLGPLTGRGVWIKRTVTAGAGAYADDGCTLAVKGTPA